MSQIAAILAALVASHVCSQQDFTSPDGSTLSVVVCPFMHPAKPDEKPKTPT